MQDLREFLEGMDRLQGERYSELEMFQPEKTARWTPRQRRRFVRDFNHARGHFDSFLWYLASHSTDKAYAEEIIGNIRDEMGLVGGEKLYSHEQLFKRFARTQGVEITVEGTHRNQPRYLEEFNFGHLAWCEWHGEESSRLAFMAYERLDNVDYARLLALGKSFGVSGDDLLFFQVHCNATHFDNVSASLRQSWTSSPERVQEAFDFIYGHQHGMWKELSKKVELTQP